MIIKDKKTRLCFIINLRCLTHVGVFYDREQYKVCLPGFLSKNKVLMKTYIGTSFLCSLSTFKERFTLPGSWNITFKRQTITCVFQGSTSLKWLLSTYRARLLELLRIQSPARPKRNSLIIHGNFLKDQYLTWIIWEVLSLIQ